MSFRIMNSLMEESIFPKDSLKLSHNPANVVVLKMKVQAVKKVYKMMQQLILYSLQMRLIYNY